ncbi:MAG TPA: hypothetical protein VGD77_17170 [Gemmatimonadaceae bacterium]
MTERVRDEGDHMTCRFCGNLERASEGYPCVDCGTFLCVMCNMRGVIRCRDCEAKFQAQQPPTPPQGAPAA